MKVAVYYRMSTDRQEDSIERQRMAVEEHCRRKGYAVVARFQDEGRKGWDLERPEFARMLAEAAAGQFSRVVVDEGSRLSRSDPVDHIISVVGPLRAVGVSVESVADGVQDYGELAGHLMSVIRQHSSAEESRTLGRRSATGVLRRVKEDGVCVGRAPFGLVAVKGGMKGKQVGYKAGDPAAVEVVRGIFRAYADEDASLRGLADRLNREGIPTVGRSTAWGVNSLHSMLTNRAYVGDTVFGRVGRGRYARSTVDGVQMVPGGKRGKKTERRPASEWVIREGAGEGIIDRETFDRVQCKLSGNRKRTSPSRRRGVYPLAQLLICDRCGRPMVGVQYEGVPAYRCGSAINRGTCINNSLRESVILGHILTALRGVFGQPEQLARLRAELETGPGEDGGRAEELTRSIDRLTAEVTKMAGNLGLLDPENIPAVQAAIREKRATVQKLTAERDRLCKPSAEAAGIDGLLSRVERLAEAAGTAGPTELRQFIRSTVARVDVRYDVVERPKQRRYRLTGGTLTLGDADSQDLSVIDSGTGSKFCNG